MAMENDRMAAIKGKIVLSLLIFGIAFLDDDYKPLESSEDLLNSALVLAFIFLPILSGFGSRAANAVNGYTGVVNGFGYRCRRKCWGKESWS